VELVLRREDVNHDILDTAYGRTPLTWGAEHGCEGVVRLLFEWEDVNPDSSSKSGRTPLAWAAENGCGRVAELLLEREDANPNSSSESGETPLTLAAKSGHDSCRAATGSKFAVYPVIGSPLNFLVFTIPPYGNRCFSVPTLSTNMSFAQGGLR